MFFFNGGIIFCCHLHDLQSIKHLPTICDPIYIFLLFQNFNNSVYCIEIDNYDYRLGHLLKLLDKWSDCHLLNVREISFVY